MWKLLKRVERPVVQCHVIHFVFAAHTDSGAALRTVSKLPMFSFSHLFSKVFAQVIVRGDPSTKDFTYFPERHPLVIHAGLPRAWFLKTLPGYLVILLAHNTARRTPHRHTPSVSLVSVCLSQST